MPTTYDRFCFNCDAKFLPRRRDQLFCGEGCRQIAELVRYGRRKLAERTFERPDIAEAIRSRASVLIRGFYDKRGERHVPDNVRTDLKGIGSCQKCGHKFTSDGDRRFTIQHIRAGDKFVLEAWCYRCNMDQALSVQITLNDEDVAFIVNIGKRMRALSPMRRCDEEDWKTKWRGLVPPPTKRKPTASHRPNDGRPKAWRADRPYPGIRTSLSEG